MFSLQQSWRRRWQNRVFLEGEAEAGAGEGRGSTVYVHVSKCKNDKAKEEKNFFNFKGITVFHKQTNFS
jgi:hypothetical protein